MRWSVLKYNTGKFFLYSHSNYLLKCQKSIPFTEKLNLNSGTTQNTTTKILLEKVRKRSMTYGLLIRFSYFWDFSSVNKLKTKKVGSFLLLLWIYSADVTYFYKIKNKKIGNVDKLSNFAALQPTSLKIDLAETGVK